MDRHSGGFGAAAASVSGHAVETMSASRGQSCRKVQRRSDGLQAPVAASGKNISKCNWVTVRQTDSFGQAWESSCRAGDFQSWSNEQALKSNMPAVGIFPKVIPKCGDRTGGYSGVSWTVEDGAGGWVGRNTSQEVWQTCCLTPASTKRMITRIFFFVRFLQQLFSIHMAAVSSPTWTPVAGTSEGLIVYTAARGMGQLLWVWTSMLTRLATRDLLKEGLPLEVRSGGGSVSFGVWGVGWSPVGQA